MRLFGIALVLALAILAVAPRAEATGPVENVLYSFGATSNDGTESQAALIQGSDGYLYGTSRSGGTGGNGTIFKIAANGTGYQVIHRFTGSTTDGGSPAAALIQASDGNLYGTTAAGGQFNQGVIFEIATDGSNFTVLHSFGATATDGEAPYAGLIQASDGNLYGTTGAGGANSGGTIFRIGLGGSGYAMLLSLGVTTTDAIAPVAPLYQAQDGYLYGTANRGGTSNQGAIFKIQPNGTHYQVIYSFAGGTADGAHPAAPVIEATDGNLYGTTVYGGTGASGNNTGNGVIYEISPYGLSYSVVQFLTSADGINPLDGLVPAPDGYLYGTTQGSSGGATYGLIYRIPLGGGSFTDEYSFGGGTADGSDPQAGVCLASNGELYGTTAGAGADNDGVVYSLQVPGLAAAPTGLLAVAGDTQVGLSWNAYLNATTYNVYRGTSSGGESVTPVATGLSTPSYIDTGLTNGTTYYYKVTAVVSSVETAQSAEAAAKVEPQIVMNTYAAGLQMISAPANFTGFAPWQAFDDGPITLAVWNPATSEYVLSPTSPANVIVPGQGYWVRFGAPQADLLDIGVNETGAQAVSVPLATGWNMVGSPDPYPQAISALSVQVGTKTYTYLNANKAGIIGATLYTWQPSDTSYEMTPASSGSIAPYKGYWVYVFKACTLIFPMGS